MNEANATPKDRQAQLAQDFKAVVNDAEELLRCTAHDAGQSYSDARARLEKSLKTARHELDGMEHALLDRARHVSRATDDYVHRPSLGIDRHRRRSVPAGGHTDRAQVNTTPRALPHGSFIQHRPSRSLLRGVEVNRKRRQFV